MPKMKRGKWISAARVRLVKNSGKLTLEIQRRKAKKKASKRPRKRRR